MHWPVISFCQTTAAYTIIVRAHVTVRGAQRIIRGEKRAERYEIPDRAELDSYDAELRALVKGIPGVILAVCICRLVVAKDSTTDSLLVRCHDLRRHDVTVCSIGRQ